MITTAVSFQNPHNKKRLIPLENLVKSTFLMLYIITGAEGLEPTTSGFGNQHSTNSNAHLK